ncbi:MAG TPA: DUF1122 family protein [Dehalococcoidia bacterium]|nr:DUF1122 family protein [Dehalococcoidia bacterium]
MSSSALWHPLEREPDHPLAALARTASPFGRLHVALGPHSRYGARWFRLCADGRLLAEGLYNNGPRPSFCWIEVARTADLDDDGNAALFGLLRPLIPPGGHIMVEYDSPSRADVAQALAAGVPPPATSLGEQLIRAGFGPRFKDWAIAEGGLEGPRKLQCYVPPDGATARAWAAEAGGALKAFLAGPSSHPTPVVAQALERARRVLTLLQIR